MKTVYSTFYWHWAFVSANLLVTLALSYLQWQRTKSRPSWGRRCPGRCRRSRRRSSCTGSFRRTSFQCNDRAGLQSRTSAQVMSNNTQNYVFKYGPNPASFVYFCSFAQCKDKYSKNLSVNVKSGDARLGTRTWVGRMEGSDKSTELWWHPLTHNYIYRENSS